MTYTDIEKKEVLDFWINKYVTPCEKCAGKGIIDNKMCECNRRATASATLEINGCGRRYLSLYIQDGTFKNEMTDYFIKFQKAYQHGRGLFIYGRQNRGKTIAVHILARNILENMDPFGKIFSIYFYLYDNLVRQSYDDKSFAQLERIINKTNILILDNLGTETGLMTQGKSSLVLLENILRSREINGLPTWITTNKNPEIIKQLYGEEIYNILLRNMITVNAF